jgi:hypothetical protein
MPSRISAHPAARAAHVGTGATPHVPLEQAIPALLSRLQEVVAALDGAAAPFPPPGFQPVPENPPSRRERALLVQFAWTAYTVLAGRPPGDIAPAEWPYRLASLVPLTQRRPDVLPTLARLIDRVLTAPPLAPLPSAAGFEELLRRASAKITPAAGVTPLAGARLADAAVAPGVVVRVDFSPETPEAAGAVIARLELLAGILASSDEATPIGRRRGLFRLGWTGWERLHGEPPYDGEHPYALQLGSPAPLRSPRLVPLGAPAGLVPLLVALLDQRLEATPPSLDDVRALLARWRAVEQAPSMPNDHAPIGAVPPDEDSPADARPTPLDVARAAAAEAARMLDQLAAEGLVRPGSVAAVARSLEERLAAASLAWSVYRAAAGHAPIRCSAEGAEAYQPLTEVQPAFDTALAAAVDATLAPESPHGVPGLATWLSVATAAAKERSPAATAAPVVPGRPDTAPARRRVQLLPDEALRPGTTAAFWRVGLVLGAAAAAGLIAQRLSAGP